MPRSTPDTAYCHALTMLDDHCSIPGMLAPVYLTATPRPIVKLMRVPRSLALGLTGHHDLVDGTFLFLFGGVQVFGPLFL